jgi:hypothetical protein
MTDIFVFGSNLQGRHGKGAALEAATNWGAVEGIGEGLQGFSYAIPTKETPWRTLPLKQIERHVKTFLKFAEDTPHLTYKLTPIGTGLAGYSVDQIAPMFLYAPPNVEKPQVFLDWEETHNRC